MGFKLRREVRDLLPPGLLTARERCLVLEIADSCDDDERMGYPGVEWLANKADMPGSKVGETIASVSKKWIELRVPLGVGKDGRPFYSRPKRRTTYRFPPREELEVVHAEKAPESGGPISKAPRVGVPKAPESGGPKAPQNGGGRPPEPGDPSPYRSPHGFPYGSPQEWSGVEWAPSGRFAPSGPDDDTEPDQPLFLEASPQPAKGFTDWKPEDYERFVDLLGTDKIVSRGGKAGKAGVYSARNLYEGMQRMTQGGGPKKWPGKYLEGIYARDPENGVIDWLDSYDLEPDWPDG